MKKTIRILVVIAALFVCFSFVLGTIPRAKADSTEEPVTTTAPITTTIPEETTAPVTTEPVVTTEAPEIEEYPSSVVISNTMYGDLMVDVTEGNVGDVVTIYAKPYTLCKLVSVSANGTQLVADEEGNFHFALIEGENIIDAKFEIDQEQIRFVAGLIEDAKDGNWSELFSVKNLFTILSWLIMAGSTAGLCVTFLKSKKIKSETAQNVAQTTLDVINSNEAKIVKDFLNGTFGPAMEKINDQLANTENVCKVLARCMILAQEGTPEARLAIIQELTSIQNSESDLAAQVKQLINEAIEKNKAIESQKMQQIAELEEANNSIEVVEPETDNNSETKAEPSDLENIKGRY